MIIPAPKDYDNCQLSITTKGIPSYTIISALRVDSTAQITELTNPTPAVMKTSTGVLTGTTGAVGTITASPDNDGSIYLENRVAQTLRFYYSFRV